MVLWHAHPHLYWSNIPAQSLSAIATVTQMDRTNMRCRIKQNKIDLLRIEKVEVHVLYFIWKIANLKELRWSCVEAP